MITRKHLFLDLEDTVITPVVEGWENTFVINVDKVQAFIDDFKPDAVHLFSFAIWNQRELQLFKTLCQPRLEAALGVKLSGLPTVDDDILPACCRAMNLSQDRVDFQEMSNFWGKHEAFRLNVRHMFKNTHQHGVAVQVVLLDDAVLNETFTWPDLAISGRLLNIDTL